MKTTLSWKAPRNLCRCFFIVVAVLLLRFPCSLFVRCSQELRNVVGDSREPYRVICRQLEKDLEETIEMLEVGCFDSADRAIY